MIGIVGVALDLAPVFFEDGPGASFVFLDHDKRAYLPDLRRIVRAQLEAVGIGGVLVQTGKFRPADLEGSAGAPDLVIADIGRLPGLLELRSPTE